MVSGSNIARSDSMSSRTARMRKRFSLPKSRYANEQRQEFELVDHDSSSHAPIAERPRLQSKDEAQLRQAVRNLDQKVNRGIEEEESQDTRVNEQRESETNTASPEEKAKKRSRRNSLSKWLMDAMEPVNVGSTMPDDVYLEFNGLVYYNCEFGSPLIPTSHLLSGGNSLPRYRPRNPASKAKNSRYSWGGFDLAHRTQNIERQDDLVAILEHDESNTQGHVAAPAPAPIPSPPAAIPRRRRSPERRSRYQDSRRSGVVIEASLADSIAADPTGHSYSALNSLEDNASGSENIQAFIPLNVANPPAPAAAAAVPEPENPQPGKRRSFIRRMSFSLFGRRLSRSSNEYRIDNSIRV